MIGDIQAALDQQQAAQSANPRDYLTRADSQIDHALTETQRGIQRLQGRLAIIEEVRQLVSGSPQCRRLLELLGQLQL